MQHKDAGPSATPPAISDAEAALLGLLCESDRGMHPWQIEKTVQQRDMRFWTDLSQSTIYKQLRRLSSRGLVDCREQIRSGRLRKVYAVSESGRTALAAKIGELLGNPQHLKWRVDLATYNIDLLPRREAVALLKSYRKRLAAQAADYRRLESYLKSHGCPWHRLALARRPLHLLAGEIRWLDGFLDELRRN